MFIGRDSEIQSMRRIIMAKEPKIAVVYGRRRIGKTTLIHQAIGKHPALFFEGLEGQSTRAQIQSFLQQAAKQLRKKLPPARSWQEALQTLDDALGKKPMVIVLDEFQWLANYRHELVSTLKMVWERHLSRSSGRTLILCGSIASFMTTKVLHSSAFYGRTDLNIHLQGFRLPEAAKLLKRRGFQEVLDAQCLTGGVPKYLELLATAPSVTLGVEKEAFRPQGYFVDEYERIFVSHFGKNAEYPRLMKALADSPYGLSRKDLAAKANITEGGMLTQRLHDLEAAGFISSHSPFDKEPSTRLLRYYLSDPWTSFYHAFMQRRLKQIREGSKKDLFISLRQTGHFHSWMGRAFELVCLQHHAQFAELLGFSGINYDVGPWFRSPRKGLQGIQIDLAYNRSDGVITLCEMKRQTTLISRGIIVEVMRKADALRTAYPKKTIQSVLILDGQVSKEVTSSGFFYAILQASDLLK